MINTFFIGDTHFGHKNIISFCRPEFNNLDEMHETIITRWNKTVSPKDKVYFLGDFCMNKTYIAEFAPQLNGTKIMILGNHDQGNMELYKYDFKKVFGVSNYKGCFLTHIPIHPQQFYRTLLNIHGHMHENKIDDNRYFNVSCEQLNYTPIEWEEIKVQRQEIFNIPRGI
jgi:calcineurin-like phosphoesterase family protein